MESAGAVAGDDPLGSIIAFIILVLVTALMAAIEIAYIAVRQSVILEEIDQGDWKARLALPMVREPAAMLAATQLGITLASVVGGATVVTTVGLVLVRVLTAWGYSGAVAYGIGLTIGTILFSYFVMVFGELVPKRLAYQFAEPMTIWFAPVLKALVIITWPLVWFLTITTAGVCRLFGIRLSESSRYSSAELAIILDMTQDLTRDEKALAKRVLSFRETEVRETMVPRTDWVALSGEATVEDFIDLALGSGFSRLPIHGQNLDDVLGVLHIKQAGQLVREGHGADPIAQHVTPALAIPESLAALDALTQLREARQQMAIVIDEFGQVVGLVTVEDLLEELVGEVFDESDRQQWKWRRAEDGSYIVAGSVGLRELSGVLGVKLPPSEDYETLGGLILDRLGRIPAENERLEISGLALQIQRVIKRRVREVRIEKLR